MFYMKRVFSNLFNLPKFNQDRLNALFNLLNHKGKTVLRSNRCYAYALEKGTLYQKGFRTKKYMLSFWRFSDCIFNLLCFDTSICLSVTRQVIELLT